MVSLQHELTGMNPFQDPFNCHIIIYFISTEGLHLTTVFLNFKMLQVGAGGCGGFRALALVQPASDVPGGFGEYVIPSNTKGSFRVLPGKF